jgi:hypothetical protein
MYNSIPVTAVQITVAQFLPDANKDNVFTRVEIRTRIFVLRISRNQDYINALREVMLLLLLVYLIFASCCVSL